MWGQIIGAGISALGSLFGKDDEEKTETTINYKKMARAAEQAGYNPLTAIRNGGSAGFTTTTHPGLSMSDKFGSAFQTLGNALMSYDARAEDRAHEEQMLVKQQLFKIQNAQSNVRHSFDVPTAAGATRSSKAATGGAGEGVKPTATLSGTENRTATNPFDTNSGILIDPNTPDANAATNRYGELGEIIFGVHAGLRDWDINREPPPITDEFAEPIRQEIRRILQPNDNRRTAAPQPFKKKPYVKSRPFGGIN